MSTPTFMSQFGGPLISAGGQLAGAGISSVGNKQAAKAQERSAQRALAFERDRENRRRQEWDYGQQLSKAQWDAWNANRGLLFQRYGLSAPTMPALPQTPAIQQPQTLGGLMGQPAPVNPIGAAMTTQLANAADARRPSLATLINGRG